MLRARRPDLRRPGPLWAPWLLLAAAPLHAPLPELGRVIWTAAVISGGVVAVRAGVRRNRPEHGSGWWRFSGGLIVYGLGDVGHVVFAALLGEGHPVTRAMWPIGYLGVPIVASGLLRVVGSGDRSHGHGTRLDAAIAGFGATAIGWHVLLDPLLQRDGWMSSTVLGSAALWLFSVGMGTAVLRRALADRALVPSLAFIALAIPLTALTSLVYAVHEAHLPWAQAPIARVLLAMAWAAGAAATWHPSMRRLDQPLAARRQRVGTALLACGILLPAAIGALTTVGAVRGVEDDPIAVALVVVTSLLCVVRFVHTVRVADRTSAALAEQAAVDQLTGVLNRSGLTARLEAAAAAGGEEHLAVLWLDLDRFKALNDTLGHHAGDALLVAVAERLQQAVCDGHHVGRMGGDEFVVVAPGCTAREVLVLAGRICELVGTPVQVTGVDVEVSVSVGIAIRDDRSTTAEALLRDADLALYRAKARGRNGYVLFDAGLREEMAREVEIERAIRAALRDDGLAIAYQPIVDLLQDRVIAAEALLRWAPGGPSHSPAETVRVAEAAGLIGQVGRWVLHRVLADLAGWLADHPGSDLRMAVNVSALQLREPGFAEEVIGALADAGVPADRLVVELTESVLLEDGDGTGAVLRELREAGVGLAMDDFGTGHSALSTLRRHPFDVLKIDRSFVAGFGIDPEDTAIVGAVLGISRAMGLQVIAEGIESAGQAAMLRRAGCTQAQGYHLGRPAPWADLTARLRAAEDEPSALPA